MGEEGEPEEAHGLGVKRSVLLRWAVRGGVRTTGLPRPGLLPDGGQAGARGGGVSSQKTQPRPERPPSPVCGEKQNRVVKNFENHTENRSEFSVNFFS